MSVGSRAVSKQGCAVCRGLQVEAGFNDLATTHPHLAAEWHPTKNINLAPTDVTAGSNKNVWWLGKCGHEWKISPNHRSKGNDCYQCLGRKKSSRQELLSSHKVFTEIHPSLNKEVKLDKLLLRSNKSLWWLGKCGHEWFAKVSSRTLGQGCAVCHGNQIQIGVNDLATVNPKLVAEWDFIKNDKKPTEVTVRSHYHAWWKCDKGHEWQTKVQTRSGGHGCPSCDAVNYVSKGEQEVADYIISLGFKVETSVRNLIKGELDIYIPEKNIAVEFNGLYWHSEAAGKGKTYHYDKWVACQEKGVQLIQIWEDDWNFNPELIKNMLAHKLGVNTTKKIFARKTQVVIPAVYEVKQFLEENHLQGYRSAKYFALQTNKIEDEEQHIVAVLGVKKTGENGLEVIRFASAVPVPGGFSKLLHQVLKHPEYIHVEEVYSYSHNDHSNGGVYESNGFELVHSGSPGYAYWRRGWKKRQNRLKYSPSRIQLNPELIYEEGLTERELADLNGLIRIWDSGSSLWVKNLGKAKP